MSQRTISIPVNLPKDPDCYLSQECPACERIFKVKFVEVDEGSENRPLSFCPYCGHEGQACWWTTEQVEYIGELQRAAAQEMVHDALSPALRRLQRSGPGLSVKVTTRRSSSPAPTPPAEPTEPSAVHHFDCCNEEIKAEPLDGPLTCILCGKQG